MSLLILFCAICDVNARASNRVARATTADNPCGVLEEDGPATNEPYNNTVVNIYQIGHEITDISNSTKYMVSRYTYHRFNLVILVYTLIYTLYVKQKLILASFANSEASDLHSLIRELKLRIR